MSDLEDAAALLAMADKDIRAIAGMQDESIFDDEVFGFHAQQAAEKALKAWLAILGQEYPLTHSIPGLLSQLERVCVDVEPFRDVEEFNPFGVRFRYEALDEAEEPIDREAAVNSIEHLVRYVNDLLSDARRQFEEEG